MTESGRFPEPESDDELWDPLAESTDSRAPADQQRRSEPQSDDELWSPDEGRRDSGQDAAVDEDATYSLSRPASPPSADPGESMPAAASPLSDPLENAGDRRATPLDETAPPARKRRRRKRKRRRDRSLVPDVPLRSALRYPLAGAGLSVLAAYAALLGIARIAPVVGPLLALVVLFWLGLLFLESASHTLEGIPGGPRFPSLDLGDVQVGLFGLAVMLMGMLPYVVAQSMVSRLGGESPVWELLFWPLPMYYLPMAFIVLADTENERGLDPRLVFRAIVRVGSMYFVLVTLAAAAFLVPSVTLTLLHVPLPLRAMASAFLMMYLMVGLLRAVGILYLRRDTASGGLSGAPLNSGQGKDSPPPPSPPIPPERGDAQAGGQ